MRLVKHGPVTASTVLCDDELIGENVSFTLPTIANQTFQISGSSPYDVPIDQRVEAMEMGITLQGLGPEVRKLIRSGQHRFEFRWAVVDIAPDNTRRLVGHKFFATAERKSIPGAGATTGEAGDNEFLFSVSRAELIVDGERDFCIDVSKGVYDYGDGDTGEEINQLLY